MYVTTSLSLFLQGLTIGIIEIKNQTFRLDYSEAVWQRGHIHIRVPAGFSTASLSLQFGGEDIEGVAYFDDLEVRVQTIRKY